MPEEPFFEDIEPSLKCIFKLILTDVIADSIIFTDGQEPTLDCVYWMSGMIPAA